MKRVFRGPWLWIVVAVVAVVLALEFLASGGGYDEVDTSQLSTYVQSGDVKDITFIDGDQVIQ
ncbi:MAG TPA: ATP-dependent metallopeptidase FtsH/Yme1/Tma family protein, partial [Nocardioides sp.]|nr:ATP-dependent metallopeptidase FtsH/Yme1/Tma family protein [Nocardioides sp.]